MTRRMSPVGRLCLVLAGLPVLASCNTFRLAPGPDEAAPLNPPRLVSITIEYRQSAHCEGPAERCEDPVVFFSSWQRPPAVGNNGIILTRDPGGFVWRGRAFNVPVNFPPRDDPHAVRVIDPHLYGGATQGATAERLKVGGQILTVIDSADCAIPIPPAATAAIS